jgi:hypothetical protein
MDNFAVDHLDVERLLKEWRWLYPHPVRLIARDAFGNLFLEDQGGRVLRLEIHGGEVREIASSRGIFDEGVQDPVLRDDWFGTVDEASGAERGLVPGPLQAITFAIPIVFKQGGYAANAYIGELYEAVSFLGDLHHQIHELPDGAQVRLRVKGDPEEKPTG